MKLGLIAVAVVLSACSANPPQVDASPPKSAGLEVVELVPAAGALVNADTIIKAKLAYSIPPGYRGEYRVIAQFAMTTENMSTDGSFPNSGYPVLQGERGAVEIRFPLSHVTGRADVARPLRMRFLLIVTTAPGEALRVAQVGPFPYDVR